MNKQPQNVEESIYQFLSQKIAPVSIDEISASLELREHPVRLTLGKMVKEKRARRAGGGKFTVISRHKKQGTRSKQ